MNETLRSLFTLSWSPSVWSCWQRASVRGGQRASVRGGPPQQWGAQGHMWLPYWAAWIYTISLEIWSALLRCGAGNSTPISRKQAPSLWETLSGRRVARTSCSCLEHSPRCQAGKWAEAGPRVWPINQLESWGPGDLKVQPTCELQGPQHGHIQSPEMPHAHPSCMPFHSLQLHLPNCYVWNSHATKLSEKRKQCNKEKRPGESAPIF